MDQEDEPIIIELGDKPTFGTTLNWLRGRDEPDGTRIDRYSTNDGYLYERMVPSGRVIVQDIVLDEPYITNPVSARDIRTCFALGEDGFLLARDVRSDEGLRAADAIFVVHLNQIAGRFIFTYWPLRDFGSIRSPRYNVTDPPVVRINLSAPVASRLHVNEICNAVGQSPYPGIASSLQIKPESAYLFRDPILTIGGTTHNWMCLNNNAYSMIADPSCQ